MITCTLCHGSGFVSLVGQVRCNACKGTGQVDEAHRPTMPTPPCDYEGCTHAATHHIVPLNAAKAKASPYTDRATCNEHIGAFAFAGGSILYPVGEFALVEGT